MALQYQLSKFDYIKAKTGSLCAVIRVPSEEPTTITSDSEDFIGVSFGRADYNERTAITIHNISYVFNRDGSHYSKNSDGLCIRIVTDVSPIVTEEPTPIDSGDSGETRADVEPGTSTEIPATPEETLRDTIAMQILPELLSKMEQNPLIAGFSEKLYCCQQAYEWANAFIEAKNL